MVEVEVAGLDVVMVCARFFSNVLDSSLFLEIGAFLISAAVLGAMQLLFRGMNSNFSSSGVCLPLKITSFANSN